MNYKNVTPDEYCQTIIHKINDIIEKKGIRQMELASLCNIAQPSLSKILKGEMRLTLQHVFKLCAALDITPEKLVSLDSDVSDIPHETSSKEIQESGLFYESYMNEEILIRNTNHPVFNGYKNNTFHVYLYSTITSESYLLEGLLSFKSAPDASFCKADMTLYTGKVNANGEKIKKYYSGELIISLTMGACYCVLTNTEIGEICFINFKHMFLFNRELECRVGTISSTSSGGNRLPVIQRLLITQKPLKVNGSDSSDLEFLQGQLRLNNSKMIIEESTFEKLKEKYKQRTELLDFFNMFQQISMKKTYFELDEASMKDISTSSEIKTEGLGILRNASSAIRYNKISTKTDEFVFEYICTKMDQGGFNQ